MEQTQPEFDFNTQRPVPTNSMVETSLESAKRIEGKKHRYRKMIYDYIKGKGTSGATCDEVEVKLDLRHQTASCFIRFLVQDFLLKDSGGKRMTRAGRNAIVWRAA